MENANLRTWLLTNTTYVTWLPGDPRGSVTSVRDVRAGDEPAPARIERDHPGEPWEEAIPGLRRCSIEQMKGPPVYLDQERAETLLAQFQETASLRGWTLRAVAVMANHYHLVVTVSGDPEPGKVLSDFKAYATRRLNRCYGAPPSGTW